jgi:hypothetical protein
VTWGDSNNKQKRWGDIQEGKEDRVRNVGRGVGRREQENRWWWRRRVVMAVAGGGSGDDG